MTHIVERRTGSVRSSPVAGHVAILARGLAGAVRASILRRKTVAELSRLDDRLLSDIGLTRGAIPEVARALGGAAASRTAPWAGLVDSLRTARVRRALIRDLERMPDWILRDIGIPRHEIHAAADHILARAAQRPEPNRIGAASPVHDLLRRIEAAARPLRQWHQSRVAAGQLARLHRSTLDDLGYVKGDVDWVPEVLAKRNIERAANRNERSADVA